MTKNVSYEASIVYYMYNVPYKVLAKVCDFLMFQLSTLFKPTDICLGTPTHFFLYLPLKFTYDNKYKMTAQAYLDSLSS